MFFGEMVFVEFMFVLTCHN